MKQKGFSAILIIILVALIIGGYFIYQKQSKQTIPSQQNAQFEPTPTQPKNYYTNTTLGISFNPPYGWGICDDYGTSVSLLRNGGTDECDGSAESIVIETNSGTLTVPVGRQQGQSFIEWVKQYSKADTAYIKPPTTVSSEFTDITPNSILEKRTYNRPDSHTDVSYQDILYIQHADPLKNDIMIQSDNKHDDIMKDLAVKMGSVPITTGDIVIWGSKDLQGYIYAQDKQSIIANFTIGSLGRTISRLGPGDYYVAAKGGNLKAVTVSLGKAKSIYLNQ